MKFDITHEKPKTLTSLDGDNTDLCRDGSVDTVFSTGDGSYYVFKGSKYWKLTDDSVAAGYPRDIASNWPGTQSLYRVTIHVVHNLLLTSKQ